ncbi:tetratricopeptide repeat protein [Desulfovibrio sp. TomC]|uniref:tetratricopeptide repeat protein n=1 Tax=Desulfovibrio sp. TomC TaxID=1562888 RepID=UPI00057535E1|nr:tetratricopeptide repeat protein [Desulfovibrio sp. TomC]KHK04000.1 TPR repeat-containing protein [Desulfovibrio sp. TomC]
MTQENRITGIFSLKTTITVGFGVTKNTALSETYWFVKEIDNDRFEVQSLDMDFKRQGKAVVITRDKLFEEYHLEPDLSYRMLSQPLLVGDHYRTTAKYANAEQEYQKIKRIDEDNIRANFGLGLVYLALNKTDKATYIFDRLVRLEEAFEPQHKHLFNEFGINLRKKGLFAEALKYYFRARELSRDDDHLLLNIARVYFEQNQLPEAEGMAKEALALNPDLAEAKRLLERIWNTPVRLDTPRIKI